MEDVAAPVAGEPGDDLGFAVQVDGVLPAGVVATRASTPAEDLEMREVQVDWVVPAGVQVPDLGVPRRGWASSLSGSKVSPLMAQP